MRVDVAQGCVRSNRLGVLGWGVPRFSPPRAQDSKVPDSWRRTLDKLWTQGFWGKVGVLLQTAGFVDQLNS